MLDFFTKIPTPQLLPLFFPKKNPLKTLGISCMVLLDFFSAVVVVQFLEKNHFNCVTSNRVLYLYKNLHWP